MSYRDLHRASDLRAIIADILEQLRRLQSVQITFPSPESLVTTETVAEVIEADMSFGVPGESRFGDRAAEGISLDLSRSDHRHDRADDWRWFWAQVGP